MILKHVNKYCNYGWIFTVDPFRQKDSQKVPPTVLLILIGLAKFTVVIMTKNSNLTGEIKWKIIRKIWKFKKQDSLTPGFIDRFFFVILNQRGLPGNWIVIKRLNYKKSWIIEMKHYQPRNIEFTKSSDGAEDRPIDSQFNVPVARIKTSLSFQSNHIGVITVHSGRFF